MFQKKFLTEVLLGIYFSIFIIIDTIVDNLGAVSMKDMGRVMSEANKKIGSQADGKLIANIVRNKLQQINYQLIYQSLKSAAKQSIL